MKPWEKELSEAARRVRGGTALLVGAGAGMGVDSGLPDFRGPEGFWRAYPPYQQLGLRFEELANPVWFRRDPELAWGFYGHRLALYRRTVPHDGFRVLRSWGARMRHGMFVFTSNVDGQFQKAGFDPGRVHEVHGSLHHLQCLERCGAGILPADGVDVDVDPVTFRARGPLPACPRCGRMARPNVLMFGDSAWDEARSGEQEAQLGDWLDELRGDPDVHLVVVECGAGTGVPTVRRFSEMVGDMIDGTLVRINVREPQVPDHGVGIPLGAREALVELERRVAAG